MASEPSLHPSAPPEALPPSPPSAEDSSSSAPTAPTKVGNGKGKGTPAGAPTASVEAGPSWRRDTSTTVSTATPTSSHAASLRPSTGNYDSRSTSPAVATVDADDASIASSGSGAGSSHIPQPPEVTAMDQAEETQMAHTLAKKKSWLHLAKRSVVEREAQKLMAKRPHTHVSKNNKGKKGKKGKAKKDQDPGEDEAADEAEAEAFDPQAMQAEVLEEACQLNFEHIDLVVGKETVHSAAQLAELEAALGKPPSPGASYVWEVMYENQRGISLFGSTWYSWRSLLPGDPTPFTLPLDLPETEQVIRGWERGARSRHSKINPTNLKRKTIKSGYTLETYQTPSPEWTWCTEWMVNMRPASDEQGWQYNLWFHRKHWRAFPMTLNWWGWVRRRQWLRLRVLLAEKQEDDADEKPAVQWDPTLREFLTESDPVTAMVTYLGKYSLDREKLAAIDKWIDGAGVSDCAKLADVLAGSEELHELARIFVYPASRNVFFKSLQSHDIITERDCRRCLTPIQ